MNAPTDPQSPYTNEGRLVVNVFTAGGAFPIPNASVLIQGAEPATRGISYTVLTDESGRTAPITLPAPSAQSSLSPGLPNPFSVYNIIVQKDGYYTHEARQIPVFQNVISIQPAEMIPLPLYRDETLSPRGNTVISENGPKVGGV